MLSTVKAAGVTFLAALGFVAFFAAFAIEVHGPLDNPGQTAPLAAYLIVGLGVLAVFALILLVLVLVFDAAKRKFDR